MVKGGGALVGLWCGWDRVGGAGRLPVLHYHYHSVDFHIGDAWSFF